MKYMLSWAAIYVTQLTDQKDISAVNLIIDTALEYDGPLHQVLRKGAYNYSLTALDKMYSTAGRKV